MGSFPLTGQPQLVTDAAIIVKPEPTVPVAPQAPMLRADTRRPAGIAFQASQAFPRGGEVRGPSTRVPPDPHELAIGSIQPAITPFDRANALGLLERAEQNGKMHIRTMPPYKLTVSFIAAGNVQHTGLGEVTESWANGGNWRWTANLGGYSIVRVGSRGMIADAQRVSTIPMRIQMMRSAIFWAEYAPTPNAMLRTVQAQWNSRPVTCVLTSNMAPVASSERLWEEQERCIDNATGLLQVHSVAPGMSTIYGYSKNQQFHGRAVPDQITIYINGALAIDAQVSLTDLGNVDPSLFTITPEMAASGPPITLMTNVRFAQNVGDVSGTARPVIVHVTIDGMGNPIDPELCAASDPALGQQALDIIKKTSFSPTGASQRDAYINVRFGN